MKFKAGDRVRIRGDYSDGTDHLDGMVGTIVEQYGKVDYVVRVDNQGEWLIWWWNLTNA